MKKKIVFLTVSLILLSCTLSYANADVEKDIVFNGIPWGINGSDLLEQMEKKGFRAGTVDESSMPIWTLDFRNDWQYNVKDTGYYIGYYFRDDHNTKIGGYELDNILQYAYYDTSDGKLNKPNCHYYKTEISFDVDTELVGRAYDDLKGKMTTLYGTGEEATSFILDTNYRYIIWKGTNNTAACLYMSEGKENNYLHLMYGITNCEETLNHVREVVVNSIPLSDPDDYNGL